MTSKDVASSPARDPSTTIVPSKPTHRVPSGGVVFGSYPVAGSKILTRVTCATTPTASTIDRVSPRLPVVVPAAALGVGAEPTGSVGSDPNPVGVVAPQAAMSVTAAPRLKAASAVRAPAI